MVYLDTSFIIDLLRGDKSIKNKLKQLEKPLKITTTSVMEIITGSELSNNKSSEKEKIKELLQSLIVVPFDKKCAIKAGVIEAKLIKSGKRIEIEDVMIAATAIVNNDVLVTRNIKHFEKIKDLKIERY